MICETIRKGKECPFMTAKGCSYNGGICHEIVENCQGCNRTIEPTCSMLEADQCFFWLILE